LTVPSPRTPPQPVLNREIDVPFMGGGGVAPVLCGGGGPNDITGGGGGRACVEKNQSRDQFERVRAVAAVT
jgi:hypothetical protein